MRRTQWLARQVADLSATEFAEFRRWFLKFEADAHDHDDVPTPAHGRTIPARAVDEHVVEALSEYGARPRDN